MLTLNYVNAINSVYAWENFVFSRIKKLFATEFIHIKKIPGAI